METVLWILQAHVPTKPATVQPAGSVSAGLTPGPSVTMTTNAIATYAPKCARAVPRTALNASTTMTAIITAVIRDRSETFAAFPLTVIYTPATMQAVHLGIPVLLIVTVITDSVPQDWSATHV
jgi:hypothetical protein